MLFFIEPFRKLCYNLPSVVTFTCTFIRIFDEHIFFFTELCKNCRDAASKFALFSVSGLKDEKLIKKSKPTLKTQTCKLYSGVFLIFLPNVVKIDPYNFELCRFKLGAFFESQSRIYAINKKLHNIRTFWRHVVCATENHGNDQPQQPSFHYSPVNIDTPSLRSSSREHFSIFYTVKHIEIPFCIPFGITSANVDRFR